LTTIFDHNGIERNLGTWTVPESFVSALPPYEDDPSQPMFTDEEIIEIVSAPDRRVVADLVPFDKYGLDQHSTSQCNGAMGAGALTGSRVLQGIDDGFVGSGAYVYSKINGGRDAGSNLEDGMLQLMNGGTCSIETVPYDKIYPRMYSKAADEEAKNYRIENAYWARTLQGFKSGLAAGHMGCCVVHVGRSFNTFTDGVCGVDSGPGNHAVLGEDIIWTGKMFRFPSRNSWGLRFGNKGRMLLTERHFTQTFNFHRFYLVPANRLSGK